MKLIAFVGLPGSGKSEASKMLRELGIPVISGGSLIREETEKRGYRVSSENVSYIANLLRMENGMNAIAKLCIKKAENLNCDIISIDGIRNIEEIDLFKKTYGNDFITLGVRRVANTLA